MNISDIIQLISTIITAITAISSILIAKSTLKQNNHLFKEANQADVYILITPCGNNEYYQLNVHNAGKSSANITKIDLSPELSYSTFAPAYQPITKYKNIYLAPNQSISTLIPHRDYENKTVDITITYTSLGNTITKSYSQNLKYFNGLLKAKEI